jgi:paired amphipathic helix protein Sin3a
MQFEISVDMDVLLIFILQGVVNQGGKPLTEAEVYSQVAKLFQNQEDLLSEFGQFLPDANGVGFLGPGLHLSSLTNADSALGGMRNDHSSTVKKPGFGGKGGPGGKTGQVRRPAGPSSSAPPSKVCSLNAR